MFRQRERYFIFLCVSVGENISLDGLMYQSHPQLFGLEQISRQEVLRQLSRPPAEENYPLSSPCGEKTQGQGCHSLKFNNDINRGKHPFFTLIKVAGFVAPFYQHWKSKGCHSLKYAVVNSFPFHLKQRGNPSFDIDNVRVAILSSNQ